jgi:hypothetical protein
MNSEWWNLVGALLFIAVFVVLFIKLRILARVRKMSRIGMQALAVIGDVTLSDIEKEKQMQTAAIQLGGQLLIFSLCITLMFAGSLATLWGGEEAGWITMAQVLAITLSWPFMLTTTLMGILLGWAWRRLNAHPSAANSATEASFDVNYSTLERLLHQFAFSSRDIQLLISKLEDKIFARSQPQANNQPVYIAALPRAGTTLLLELCMDSGQFVTHTYRDMPFILTPLFWRKFSHLFKTTSAARERAHGDGMLVSLDSPEAFEEVLWMTYWEDQYHSNQINPWPSQSTPKFDAFFSKHRNKLASFATSHSQHPRYVSKNNLNIARVELITNSQPTSKILIPFRHPTKHCSSLLRQHLNFLSIHQNDAFAKIYMAGVGHFDFGDNLKPINFDQWLDNTPYKDPSQLSFWCDYWIATYQHLLGIDAKQLCFVDFDALCQSPTIQLQRIATFIELDDPERLIKQASRLKPTSIPTAVFSDLEPELLERVHSTYTDLVMRAEDKLAQEQGGN